MFLEEVLNSPRFACGILMVLYFCETFCINFLKVFLLHDHSREVFE